MHELKETLQALGIVLLIALPIVGSTITWIWFDAKKEVKKSPREPMLICNTHGFFPARHSIKMDVPGATQGLTELCPFCYNDRVSKKKVL